MGLVFRLEGRIISWTRAVAALGCGALLVVALGTMLDVLSRWVLNLPIRGLHDVNGLAIAIVIAACFPLVVAERRNISIRFLGDALGAGGSRWLEALGSAALLAFIVAIAWQLTIYTLGMAESGRTTWHLRLPVTPAWTVATALVVLCIPAQAIAFVADVARALRRE